MKITSEDISIAMRPTSDELDNLPVDWKYNRQSNTVECHCMFRFGAEHMSWDGSDTCPNCELDAINKDSKAR